MVYNIGATGRFVKGESSGPTGEPAREKAAVSEDNRCKKTYEQNVSIMNEK